MTASSEQGRIVRATDLIGRRVVTLGGNSSVEVKDVVFDTSAGSVTGFTLRAPGLLGGPQSVVLPIAGVESIGDDAVMITDEQVFAQPEALVGSGDDIMGDRIITDDGTALGTVTDVAVLVTKGDGDIIGFEIEPTDAAGANTDRVLVPSPDALAMSDEAIVVPAAARDHITTDVDALRSAAASLRGSSS